MEIFISKTRLYCFDPLKPHFHTVKLGFTGVYIIFLISAQKHRLLVLVRTASVSENIRIFYLKIFLFWVVKFSIYLNRRIFAISFIFLVTVEPIFVSWKIECCLRKCKALRKHAYSNILKILQPKTVIFQINNSYSFHIPAQNIGEAVLSMFLSRNEKIMSTPVNPIFII